MAAHQYCRALSAARLCQRNDSRMSSRGFASNPSGNAGGEAFEVRTSGARQMAAFSPASSRVARGEGAFLHGAPRQPWRQRRSAMTATSSQSCSRRRPWQRCFSKDYAGAYCDQSSREEETRRRGFRYRLWGMKRGRAWRPTLPAAEWGEGVSAPCWASTPPGVWGMKRRRSALPRQGNVLVGPGLQEATVSVRPRRGRVGPGWASASARPLELEFGSPFI